ncbi:iron-sulfur cluster biosynthesis family protein [Enterococcus termitis]|jgi:uncharacterized protein YqkB|uniref:Core domain-containing protein n=1 Tax=Enterococcus termitis TaxID=332950 RepID=A0A1E5G951_9ENTE|nr:iron-sulfur cluster biosynthesis family protein [Enterococcus termitis]OEG09209.1 hypothetical protein BCR25_11620 [Enterococcus termitis]OJG98674.1 hypothetical protein RV18_GL003097 [Enterococcus termitis]
MYLNISEEAKAKLMPYVESQAVIILDLDDGVGKYSKMGVCSLDTSFRILLLDQSQDRSDFTATIRSELGTIYIKDYSPRYLDKEMTLDIDPRLQVLKLSSSSGILDGNVPIVDLRGK